MTKAIKSVIIIAILGIVIWWMSSEVIWLGDDLNYKYRMNGAIWQSWGQIKSWNDFWNSQFVHYMNVNGRFVAHSFVQLFNGVLGQQFFAICNSLMYIFFALILAKAGNVKFKTNPGGILTAVCLSAICFITKMMPTCQIGYIWGMTVNLWWLTAFFGKGRLSWRHVAFLAFSGIIVGNWQEGISIGVCAALGIWWLNQLYIRKKTGYTLFDWQKSLVILGYYVGTATNCLSPATIGRATTINIPLFDQLLITSYSIPAILILIVVLIYLKLRQKCILNHHTSTIGNSIPNSFLLTAIIILLIFNAVIGVYSNRQLFGANLFAAIIMLRILPKHRFNIYFNIIAVIVTITTWGAMAIGLKEVQKQYLKISQLHQESKTGIVAIDRTRVMTLGHPSNAKYYEDILGQFDNDLHHSLMKDFKHERKGKTLKLVPTSLPNKENVECYAPGHFNVTVRLPQKEEPKREVLIYGHYSILRFINIPASPRKLPILTYSHRRSPYGTTVIIPEYPFFMADSVQIL